MTATGVIEYMRDAWLPGERRQLPRHGKRLREDKRWKYSVPPIDRILRRHAIHPVLVAGIAQFRPEEAMTSCDSALFGGSCIHARGKEQVE